MIRVDIGGEACYVVRSKGLYAKLSENEEEAEKMILKVYSAIAPGEVHVIMGPNGSGKSTLANDNGKSEIHSCFR